MIEVLPPLVAYGKDLSRVGRAVLTPCDAELLRVALVLQRYAGIGREEGAAEAKAALRQECARLTQVVRDVQSDWPVPVISADADVPQLVGSLRAVANVAEEFGAFRLAYSILHLVELAFGPDAGALERGRLLAQRARVTRLGGNGEAADVLYGLLQDAATSLDSPELHARAHFGFGLRARERGNLPLMQKHTQAALEYALAAKDLELIAGAHHGLTAVAGELKKFDEAVMHAWAGFRDVRGDASKEAHALVNVAQAILDFGEPAIALRAYVTALTRRLPMRLELPALGGAAIAAARIGDRRMLDRIVNRLDVLAGTGDLRFDTLSAQAEAVTALIIMDDARAEPLRLDVLARASAGGFHSVVYRMEHTEAKDAGKAPSVTVSAQMRVTLDEVEQVSLTAELLTAF